MKERDLFSAPPKIILGPVRASSFAAASNNRRSGIPPPTRRPIVPHSELVLHYAAANPDRGTNPAAWVNVKMSKPSILLEDIDSVSQVDCSNDRVVITFSNLVDHAESSKLWPQSDFILFTNSLGCNEENERGLYDVGSVAYDQETLTVTAVTSRICINDYTERLSAEYNIPAQVSPKRHETSRSFVAKFPEKVELEAILRPSKAGIKVSEPEISGRFDLVGRFDYDFDTLLLESASADVSLEFSASVKFEVEAGLSYTIDRFEYSRDIVNISPFSIPGVADIGPMIKYELGVEFASSAENAMSTDLSVELTQGTAHIDFLNVSNTRTEGWKPTFKGDASISSAYEAQINPYVQVSAEVGISILRGLFDLGAGIAASPKIANAFTFGRPGDAESGPMGNATTYANQMTSANSSTDANVTSSKADAECPSGMQYSNSFQFAVFAFVNKVFEYTLMKIDVPIHVGECWIPENSIDSLNGVSTNDASKHDSTGIQPTYR